MVASTGNRPSLLDYSLLFGLAAVWGSAFIFIKIGVSEIPPVTMTAYRLVAAILPLWLVYLFVGQPLPNRPAIWGLVALAGFFGTTLPFFLIAWGQTLVEPGLTAILMAIMPLMTLLLAHLFTEDEKFSVNKGLGVLMGILGVVMLVGPAALFALGGDFFHQLAILGGATCYAINAVIYKFLIGVPRLTLAAWSITIGLLPLIPAALVVDGPFHFDYSTGALAATVLLGLVHTSAAAFILFSLIKRQGATFFSQINLLVPLFGVFWAFLIFSEEPAINAVLALLLILAGVAVAERPARSGKPGSAQGRKSRPS
ncbi:MAG: DMT family transporter [Pseudomonadota bacterium]